MELSFKQTFALEYLEDQTTNEVIYGGGAGGGKSLLGTYWILKMCYKYPGTRWLIGREKLKTLTETTLMTLFDVMKIIGITSDQYNYNQQKNIIVFSNGSQILLKDLFAYPSDPNFDELGSLEITGAFIDECGQLSKKAWDIVRSRIRFKLDENGLIPKMLGTCNPTKNWVYSEFYIHSTKKTLPENKVFLQSLVTDNPFISKHYIDNLEQLSEIDKQRLLHGNWEYSNDPSTLIEFDRIIEAFDNQNAPTGTKYISADVARFGSDKTVIIVWNGLRAIKILSFPITSITDTVQIIQKNMRDHNIPARNVIADEDGLGSGVVDTLNCKGFVNNSRALKENSQQVQYQNLKSQCYFHLAEKMNNGEIGIFTNDQSTKDSIIAELEQVKRHNIDKDGKLSVLPKEAVKTLLGRSPDFADALMMRMYFELQPTFQTDLRVIASMI
ncbi:phage terminase large subunit [Epilithonimonas hominis]|uniref:phage terminase large subunit n=1 Tax=Epilithonimonas hominis TaxID=420404 RepID=UPI002899D59E|nr:phage terminase large subunit [Epilithonimonas hominis]